MSTQRNGTDISYAYDANGNMTQLVTPSGASHAFDSRFSGAQTAYAAPLSGAYAYSYDAAGRMASVTSPSGTQVTYTHEHEWVSGVTFPGGSIDYSHLPCGKLSSTTRGAETSKLTYDGPLVTREVRGGSVPATLTWSYNIDFAPTGFRYAEATQTYVYDADGLLTCAAPFSVSRDAASGLPVSVATTGFALTRTYSAYGEIDAAATAAYGYALTRDAAGRIVSRTESGTSGTHAWTYAYDPLGRLTSATCDGQLAEAYAYDADGNRTAHRAPARRVEDTITSVFDAEDRVVTSGADTYSFTADGFLASKSSPQGTSAYTYSPLGELTAVALADGRAVTYAYDGAGRRVSKSVDGLVTQRYLWADATHLLAVHDGAGALQARFLYADARTPYAADTAAGRRFLHYDQVGSLRAVTDTSGVLVRAIERDSFGVVLSDTGPASAVPIGFAGGLADPDTGLVLFGARDYDPQLGRWCAKDPIGFAGGDANLYGYCVGDPVGLADPAGLWSVGVSQSVDAGSVGGGYNYRYYAGQGAHYVSGHGIVTTKSHARVSSNSESGDWGGPFPGDAGVSPVGVQVTNARCPDDLGGTVEQHGFSVFFVTVSWWGDYSSWWGEGECWGASVGPDISANPGFSANSGTVHTEVVSRP